MDYLYIVFMNISEAMEYNGQQLMESIKNISIYFSEDECKGASQSAMALIYWQMWRAHCYSMKVH